MDDGVNRALRMAMQLIIFSLLIGTIISFGMLSKTYLGDYNKAKNLQEDMLAQKELIPYRNTTLKSDDVLLTIKTKTKALPIWVITEEDRPLTYFRDRGLLLDETTPEHIWSIIRMSYVDDNGVEQIERGLTYRLEASGGMYSEYDSFVMPHHLMDKPLDGLDLREINIQKIMKEFYNEYGYGREGIIFVKKEG